MQFYGGSGSCVRGPEGEDKYDNIIRHNNTDMEICIICCEIINGYSHNPYPLANFGKCCTSCSAKVLKSRLKKKWGLA